MKLFHRCAVIFGLLLGLIAWSVTYDASSGAASSLTNSFAIEWFSDKAQNSVVAGFDFSNLDRSVSACQDFNRFANGGWMARNPVPGAYSVWGRFTQLGEQNLEVLHQILEGLLKKTTLTPGNEQKIADFYGSCMDEPKIEAEGINPLESEMRRIDQISD